MISPTAQTPLPAAGSPFNSGIGSDLDSEAFLKMLVAQLQNQDPMDPMNADEMSVQLAQFSQVEALHGIRGEMSTLVQATDAVFQVTEASHASSLIGKHLLLEPEGSAELSLDADGRASITFDLEAPMSGGMVVVHNAEGVPVAEVELGPHGAGRHTVDIEFPFPEDAPLAAGRYSYSLQGEGLEAGQIHAYTREAIDGIRFTDKGFNLLTGSGPVPFHIDLSIAR